MPMDGFTLSFMQMELHQSLVGGRVDKISQPERDSLLLLVRSQGENHRLLLSASANHARAQLTAQVYENPAEPPMFCMLARKHLQGARVTDIQQVSGDRILVFTFEGMGELGDSVRKSLYLEMMGRHSNLSLVAADGTILDCLKHVNQEMSRVRTLLPGQAYQLPPQPDKLVPLAMDEAQIINRFASLALPLQKALPESIAGLAALCSREVCAQLSLDGAAPCHTLNWTLVAPALVGFFQSLSSRFAPVTLYDALGTATDFFPFPYQTFAQENQKPMTTLSQAMDAFFMGRDLRLRMQQRSAGLQKHIKTAIDRLEKKKGILLDTLSQSEQAEQSRFYGELLTANLHLLHKGDEAVTLTNYYDPEQGQVTIPLATTRTPAQNAQDYYKKYRKAKVAKEYAGEQLRKAQDELFFLEGALDDLEKCSTTADLAEVRRALTENGNLRPTLEDRARKKTQEGKPYRFTSPEGIDIWVGKNSVQNDRLTLHARGNETWLHAQGIPGSHVVIRTEDSPPDTTLLLAAKLAAYFSKGRNHPAQPVDYTLRKHVKKAPGMPAGFVTYTHFQTVLVGLTPEDMAMIAKGTIT